MSWTHGSYKTWGEYLGEDTSAVWTFLSAYAQNFYCWWMRRWSDLLHYEKQELCHIFDVEFRKSSKAFGDVGVKRQVDAEKNQAHEHEWNIA